MTECREAFEKAHHACLKPFMERCDFVMVEELQRTKERDWWVWQEGWNACLQAQSLKTQT